MSYIVNNIFPSSHTVKEKTNSNLINILKNKINEASKNGKYSITYNDYIPYEVKEILEKQCQYSVYSRTSSENRISWK